MTGRREDGFRIKDRPYAQSLPQDELVPDLSRPTIEYLLKRHPLPIFSGKPEDHAEYQRDVGKYELVQDLKAHFEAYSGLDND